MVIIVYSQGFSLLIMPINIMQWRLEIGMFNHTHKSRFMNLKSLQVVGLSSGFRLGIRFVFVFLILFACGDIELNLGQKKEKKFLLQFFSLSLEYKQHHCTQFCKNRSSPSL